MQGAKDKYKKIGLVIYGIGIQDSLANIKEFAEETDMTWPVVFDDGDVIMQAFGITFGAGAILIDREGIVQGRFIAAFDEESLEEALGKIL
ncbi:MAG: redoxin domain-containing protein [Deltaproteobacteria bacterium]|nr:redoxin domain-containing protein [Deltaproteobacteria bacterium]